jgi:hypothetical protein
MYNMATRKVYDKPEKKNHTQLTTHPINGILNIHNLRSKQAVRKIGWQKVQ